MPEITFDFIMSTIIAGLALIYLIVLCANIKVELRPHSVNVALFTINAMLVVATAINHSWLVILWAICLWLNGDNLHRGK